MFLFYLASIAALAQILDEENHHRAVAFVVSEMNTVHYIKSKVISNNPQGDAAAAPAKSTLSIFRDRMDDASRLVYRDEKTSDENTFFFTTSQSGKYYIVFSLENAAGKDTRLESQVYSGEANRPAIVSNSDVEVSKAEFRIRKLLEYVKNNVDFQNMDQDDDLEYRKVFADIAKKAIFVVCLKITATLFALMYSNRKIKQFFSSQGVVEQKQ